MDDAVRVVAILSYALRHDREMIKAAVSDLNHAESVECLAFALDMLAEMVAEAAGNDAASTAADRLSRILLDADDGTDT